MPVKDISRVLDEAGVRRELLSLARAESAIAEAEALGPHPGRPCEYSRRDDASDARLGADRPSRHATSQKRHEGPPRAKEDLARDSRASGIALLPSRRSSARNGTHA
jgi:hypothetical protein